MRPIIRPCQLALTALGTTTDAFDALTDRERRIIAARKLSETPETLESLGQHFKLSKERIRQLEAAAFTKMRKNLEGQSSEVLQFLL